jgi:hypothetical protein
MLIQTLANMFRFNNSMNNDAVHKFFSRLFRLNLCVLLFMLGSMMAMILTCHNDDQFFYALFAYLLVLVGIFCAALVLTWKFTDELIATVECDDSITRQVSYCCQYQYKKVCMNLECKANVLACSLLSKLAP